ncbi:hypothetical protein SASPL_104283 [Salvia splendens]|uniref:Beta-amyrin 28-oxidase n=1 Tax=Salvia splendens TaxID=180675 RepID=A0A8X8YH97_SALSN|nr:hypothetical protein SASPL_104283 [Salvia splendens]
MEKHSPEIFQTSLLDEKMAIFCGAKGNKFLFTNENKVVTSWWPKSMNKVLVFTEFVAKNPTADSAFRRILHQTETLKNLVPAMDALARQRRPSKDTEAIRTLQRGDGGEPIDLPGTAYRRAMRGGAVVRIIRERMERRGEGEEQDPLSRMLLIRDEEGKFLCAFREATTEFSYEGFTIPKGWKAFWTVHSSHMNPDYFPEPDKFDPSRFDGSGPPPYTFVPFGGGPRMCTGKEYARFELLVFMHNVVTRFRLEKTIPNEKIVLLASPVPVSGLPVYLHPLQN